MAAHDDTALSGIRETLLAARAGQAGAPALLAALTALRELREELSAWEPELVAAAREEGASWVALAPALGVASRQAAERRFLRTRPSATGEPTGEGRVEAERSRRAGDRAVAAWARRHAGLVRQLADEVDVAGFGPAAGVSPQGQALMDRLGQAIVARDPEAMLPRIIEAAPHLAGKHQDLVERVQGIAEHVGKVRRNATQARQR